MRLDSMRLTFFKDKLMSVETRRVKAGISFQIFTTTLLLGTVTVAHSQTAEKKVQDAWSLSLGGGYISTQDYEGSKHTISSALPIVRASYKSADYGRFSIETRSGLSWTPIDKEEYSLGMGLGFDFGRTDKADGTAFRPGSKRLNGMGVINASADLNLFGHYVLGVPIYVQLSKNLGSGKLDAAKRELSGSGGTRVEVGVELPWQATKELKVTLSPNLIWADKKYEQAYFGVTSAQSAASGFNVYTPKGGVKSAGLNLSADYKLSSQWTANVTASVNQLQGDAAKSSLVQRKGQSTIIVGAFYTF
jgi:MipA family protein